jgi:hypothetical protein
LITTINEVKTKVYCKIKCPFSNLKTKCENKKENKKIKKTKGGYIRKDSSKSPFSSKINDL